MNYEQITGILKILIPTVCAILAPIGFSGLSDPTTVAAITTGIIAIGAALWSYFSHTNAAKLQAAAAVDPGVKVLVPTQVMDNDPKVAALVHSADVPNVVKLAA
jgi:hypothetical protein